MLTRAESKRGHNFKVTDHLTGYKELQDEVLDAIYPETKTKRNNKRNKDLGK